VTINEKGIITSANPMACTLLGVTQGALLGRSGIQAMELSEHTGKVLGKDHPIALTLGTRQGYRSQPQSHLSLARSNETLLPVFLITTPLIADGRLLGAVVVFQDMSEERQIDYLKSEFISLASHQLRTPLSSFRWYLELLTGDKKAHLSSTQRAYMHEMDQASARMAGLLDSLLKIARLESGLNPEVQKIDVVATVRRFADDSALSMRGSPSLCECKLPDHSIQLHTDPAFLTIVLQNLVGNAMKYSTSGSKITISVLEKGRSAIIEVRDRGVGVPKDEQPRLFEKFFRARNVRVMDTTGSGLGLYICKIIIEKLGGTISFESTEGKGSTFRITLPKK
jgi:signal transduction histidine kinase